MSLSPLPLGYCTNVHPGQTIAAVEAGLDQYAVPVRANVGAETAAGLWLARPVVTELLQDDVTLDRFADGLRSRGLACHTLNAFPYGDFHSERVKENVYLPDWTDPRRLDYTIDCSAVLARLLDDGCDGSISTVPLGFKPFDHPADFEDRCIDQLIALADRLAELREETGRTVRLAIEPEPFCRLETTAETVEFFHRLWKRAGDRNFRSWERVREYIGVCYDVCHQSVEFEDVAESLIVLDAIGIRLVKIHITCAIEIRDPGTHAAAREALARYVEPRYLHQTIARSSSGEILRVVDLTEGLALDPPDEFRTAPIWRVHYHVPVDAEELGPLGTTRPDLRRALETVARLDQTPHLEVETYTWGVLPDGSKPNLVDGLTRELLATRRLLEELRGKS